jgi:hypothetical protein
MVTSLVLFALASWLYGVWKITSGGQGRRADFSGLFDQVQGFAFYPPYLAIHIWIRRLRT